MKTQKKLLYVIAVCSLFVSLWGNAYSHSPKTITAEYDHDTRILKIEAVHRVKDVNKHFIRNVEISLNGKRIIQQDMFSQFDKNKQIVRYAIVDIEVGDEIRITARCNIFGTSKKTVIIKSVKIESVEPKEAEEKK